MSNVSATYTLNLNSNVRQALIDTEAQALRVDSVMWQLQKTMSALGVGLGAHFLKDFITDAVHDAADFETAMLRIKNSSKDVADGIRNDAWIIKESLNLKIPLQEAADGYGKFLAMIGKSDLSSDQLRNLQHELLGIGKALALPSSSMESTVFDLGKLLGEGVLEARSLRQLERVFPQITQFVANELGVTKQELSRAESNSKLTKAGISSEQILLPAIEKYFDSLKDKIPETLQSVKSELNDLDNQWLIFKKDLILDNKEELVEFLNSLKSGVAWLSSHESGIKETVSDVATVVKLFIEWRLAILALEAPFAIMSFFKGQYSDMSAALGRYGLVTEKAVVENKRLLESNIELSNSNLNVVSSNDVLHQSNNTILIQNADLSEENLNLIKLDNQLAETRIKNSEIISVLESEYNEKTLKNYYIQNEVLDRKLQKEELYANESISIIQNHERLIEELNLRNLEAEQEYNSIRDEVLKTRNLNYGNLKEEQILQLQLLDQIEEDRIIAHEEKLLLLNDEILAQLELFNNRIELLQTEYLRKSEEIRSLDVDSYIAYKNSLAVLKSQQLSEDEKFADLQILIEEQKTAKIKAIDDAALLQQSEARALKQEQMWIASYGMRSDEEIAEREAWAEEDAIRDASMATGGRGGAWLPAGAASFIQGGLMNVFIAGMALEVATSLFPKGKFTGKEVGIWDFLPNGNASSIGHESKISRTIEKDMEEMKYSPEWFKEMQNKKFLGLKSDKYHEDLYENLYDKSKGVFKLDPTGNDLLFELQKLQETKGDEFGIDVIGTVLGRDSHGNIKIKEGQNEEIYDAFNKYFKSPYLSEKQSDFNMADEHDKKYGKTPKLAGHEHIKGNSSNYITVRIDNLHGVEKMTVEVSGNNFNENEFKKNVGEAVTKILTDAVNDASIIAGR